MRPLDNEFTVTLISNASHNTYPNNHVFNFTNICLQSISLTNIYDEPEIQKAQTLISNKENLFHKALEKIEKYRDKNKALHAQSTETIYKQATGIIITKLDIFHSTNTLFIECEQILPKYSKPSALVAPLSEAFAAILKKINLTGELSFNKAKHITINVSPKNMTEEEKKKTYLVILPEELIYVLGFDSPDIIFNNGYGAIPSNYGKQLTAKKKVNLSFLVPQNVLLYADCVQPSLIGNA